jgi:phage baseplate assembly protein W
VTEGKQTFIGSGWRWPLAINSQGGIARTSETDEVHEALLCILQTAPGERVMRPEFGCGIHNLVFAPINARTIGQITREIHESLGRWEPRTEVMEVEVNVDPDHDSRLLIHIRYRIKATHDERSLVYPFYLIPEEG